MFDAIRSDPSYERDKEAPGGIPYNVPHLHTVNGAQIRWRGDGFAVLERLPGAGGSAAEIGMLSAEDVAAKLSPRAPQPTIQYSIPGQTVELVATQTTAGAWASAST